MFNGQGLTVKSGRSVADHIRTYGHMYGSTRSGKPNENRPSWVQQKSLNKEETKSHKVTTSRISHTILKYSILV